MLNYECRKILDIIIELNPNDCNKIDFFDIVHYFPRKEQGKWALKLEKILKYLEKIGYITFTFENVITNIKVTYQGLSYKSFYFESFKYWLFTSIFTLISLLIEIFSLFK